MFGKSEGKSGMQMMVESIIGAAGIDPDEVKKSIGEVVSTAQGVKLRVDAIEEKLDFITEKLIALVMSAEEREKRECAEEPFERLQTYYPRW
jgi:hypothetical protein